MHLIESVLRKGDEVLLLVEVVHVLKVDDVVESQKTTDDQVRSTLCSGRSIVDDAMVQRSSFSGSLMEMAKNLEGTSRRGPVRRDPPVQSMNGQGFPYRCLLLAGYDQMLPVIP